MRAARTRMLISRLAAVLVAPALLLVLLISGASAAPTVTTDRANYYPNETVTITGSGFASKAFYDVPVIRPNGNIVTGDGTSTPGWDKVKTNPMGNFTYSYQLNGIEGTYEVRVYPFPWGGDLAETPLATTTFADQPPAGNLDQCANGPLATPTPCIGSAWVNGNLNENKAHWLEGDSVAYRLKMQNLITGSFAHTVTIEWDTTKSGKHALDYLTSFDRTETPADPCSVVSGCSLAGPKSTFAIPVDANVTNGQNGIPGGGDDITQIAGDFTLFNGTITGVSSYTLSGTYAGDSSTTITISFTASVSDPVLAWAGHIATRQDWGQGNSAIDITGAPYHMRFIDLDGFGGNQDRSLTASAVITTDDFTVTKTFNDSNTSEVTITLTCTSGTISPPNPTTTVNQSTTFEVTGGDNTTTCTATESGVPAGYTTDNTACENVNLQNLGSCTITNTNTADFQVSKNFIPDDPAEVTVILVCSTGTVIVIDPTASEADPADFGVEGFDLGATCVAVEDPIPAGHLVDVSDCAGVLITPGDTSTCTIINTLIPATLKVIKDVINDNGGTAVPADFTMSVTGTNVSPASFPGQASPGTTVTLDAGTYSVSESGPSDYTESQSADCSGTIAVGQTKTCTITNDDNPATLKVIKDVVNDNGGTNVASDFTISVTGTNVSPASFPGQGSPGTTVALDAGTYSVSESGPSGYTESLSADCSGTIAIGQTKTCTITNDDNPATLKVIKDVINDNGGTNVPGDFTMTVSGNSPSPASFPGQGSPGTTVSLDPGAYSVSESGPSGYAKTQSADCSGTIAVGETKTCTITNDDIAPTLTVCKTVINDDGGTAVASDFTISVTATNPSPASFPGDANCTTITLDAGTYSVSESGPSGYTESQSADCSGTIAIGQTKTCTITNDDAQTATLKVIKEVINDDGGTAVPADFTMSVTGTNVSPASFPGQASPGTTVTLDAGAYSVSESGPGGYAKSQSADCSGTIAGGETKTCTVTNNDGPVGGVVELRVASGTDAGPSSLAEGSATGRDYGLPAAGIAVVVLMTAAGAGYAWRRSLR